MRLLDGRTDGRTRRAKGGRQNALQYLSTINNARLQLSSSRSSPQPIDSRILFHGYSHVQPANRTPVALIRETCLGFLFGDSSSYVCCIPLEVQHGSWRITLSSSDMHRCTARPNDSDRWDWLNPTLPIELLSEVCT